MMRTFFLFCLFLLLTGTGAAQTPMTVRIDGLRNTDGLVMAFLFDNADDFPTKRDRAFRKGNCASLNFGGPNVPVASLEAPYPSVGMPYQLRSILSFAFSSW